MGAIQQGLFCIAAAVASTPFGIFGGGYTGTYSAYTDKYTYSGNTVAAGTVLGTARASFSACSSVANGL